MEIILKIIFIVCISYIYMLISEIMYNKAILKYKEKEIKNNIQTSKLLLGEELFILNKIQEVESEKIPDFLKITKINVLINNRRTLLINKIVELDRIYKKFKEVDKDAM